MMFRDTVGIYDGGSLEVSGPGASNVGDLEPSPVFARGWVRAVMTERGKTVSVREGHNIWTNTGKEFLALLMSLSSGSTKFRSDSIAYISAGNGSQVEAPEITRMVSPIVVNGGGEYLVALDTPPTFPLTPARTTVQFRRVFSEGELTLGGSTDVVTVSELGLFTDGSPDAVPEYSPGTRDVLSPIEAPVAYKSFEPMTKTGAQQLEILWEIRF